MMRLKYLIICTITLLFASSCEEIFEEDSEESGPEYFEFKVDGEEFESVSIPAQCNGLNFSYFPEPHLDLPPGFMEMVARNCSESTSLNLTFQRVISEYTGSSSLESLNFADSFQPSFRAKNNVIYNRLLDGTMTVDRFSGSHKHGSGRLTGTFEMRLIDSEKTDTLNITDGRFNFYISQKLH
ncbi:hypothetical protein O3Q51_17600 [Cryomorphaceae bacterium 1068]|nr:hypothetical protein [Cryomorphaceae bacterium 1068]